MCTSYRNLVERCEDVKWTPFRKYKVLLELHVSLEKKKKRCREGNAVVRVAYDHHLPYPPSTTSDPANSAMAAMSIVHCPLRIDFLMSDCTGMPLAPESQNSIRSDSTSTQSPTLRV
ncbi:uncharacterized protein EAF02_006834 [Botrytis sinoallii]|uniref:uncharacterized protein n=1 Tax=Botrytis sinoallii TaxID=1463999 RepID=UPI0018FF2F98|nr:uncharacterized protein EAF02_006834 [Botrytis sinoallii]KAF7880943.1 hypothetical protein EAF02_006834 [Botrytis sinoallii]